MELFKSRDYLNFIKMYRMLKLITLFEKCFKIGNIYYDYYMG